MQENVKNWWKDFTTGQAKINIANAGSVLINLVQTTAQPSESTVSVTSDKSENSLIFKFNVIA